MTFTPSLIVVALVPLILWRLYSRYRKLMSRQKSHAWRHWTAAIFFPTILVLLAVTSLVHPLSEAALAGGIVIGAVLSHFGLRSTRFESTPEGIYFTPNARIGIVLSLLLVARIAYRLYEMWGVAMVTREGQMQDFTRSPLTLVIIGMLLAYYAAYAIGILRWRRANAAAPAPGGTS
jgi:surface polysaccharide O-acyltransferase-like enzyme